MAAGTQLMARNPFKVARKGAGWTRESKAGARSKPKRVRYPKLAPVEAAPVPAGTIVLPFPPSSLSGHAEGHWRKKHTVTAEHRKWAHIATLDVAKALPLDLLIAIKDGRGDIRIHVRFVPSNRRGDRTNFPNRMKPYFDGIADALRVNDARFVPSYTFAEPEMSGRVEVVLSASHDGDAA